MRGIPSRSTLVPLVAVAGLCLVGLLVTVVTNRAEWRFDEKVSRAALRCKAAVRETAAPGYTFDENPKVREEGEAYVFTLKAMRQGAPSRRYSCRVTARQRARTEPEVTRLD